MRQMYDKRHAISASPKNSMKSRRYLVEAGGGEPESEGDDGTPEDKESGV
jgi:hypothetical protein